MKIGKGLSLPIIFALISGCAAQSMVVSKRATVGKIEKGILYSLPKQLVTVAYARKEVNPTTAAKAINSIKNSIREDILKETKLKKNGTAGNEKKANLKEVKEHKLSLTKTLYSQTIEFSTAINECKSLLDEQKVKTELAWQTWSKNRGASKNIEDFVKQTLGLADKIITCTQFLKPNKAIIEKLGITAEAPIPDTDHTFYATIDHRCTYSDTVEILTKNGLLHGDLIGHSEDKTGEIVVALARSVSGMASPSFFTKNIETPASDGNAEKKCSPNGEISITRVIDPSDQQDIDALNKRLKNDACIELTIAESNKLKTREKALEKPDPPNGLIYSQPGIVTFIVKRVDAHGKNPIEIERRRLSLAQGGQVGVLPLPTGYFSKTESDISFSNGSLSKVKIIQPSEVLGAISLIPNALKAMFAVPAELLQLKVDYSSREKELLELKKTMLELQAEIEKKKLERERR